MSNFHYLVNITSKNNNFTLNFIDWLQSVNSMNTTLYTRFYSFLSCSLGKLYKGKVSLACTWICGIWMSEKLWYLFLWKHFILTPYILTQMSVFSTQTRLVTFDLKYVTTIIISGRRRSSNWFESKQQHINVVKVY